MYVFTVTMNTHGAHESSSSVPVGAFDVLWARALSSLPAPLARSLRDAGLADASTLLNYPLLDFEEEEYRHLLGEPRGTGSASVDASSTGHCSFLSTTSGTASVPDLSISPGQSKMTTSVTATSRVDASGVTGGDPRTVHSLSVGTACGVDMARWMQEEGGDPKTDQHVPSGGEVKTDLHVPSGGEVKTDHSDFSLQTAGVSSVNADCPHSGGLATQTAHSSAVSPALDPDFGLSHGSEVRDAFPSCQEKTVQFDEMASDPVRFDGFPSIAESRDGLPSSADSKDHTNLDSTLRLFSAFPKTPNDSASRIQEFKSCPPVAAHPS